MSYTVLAHPFSLSISFFADSSLCPVPTMWRNSPAGLLWSMCSLLGAAPGPCCIWLRPLAWGTTSILSLSLPLSVALSLSLSLSLDEGQAPIAKSMIEEGVRNSTTTIALSFLLPTRLSLFVLRLSHAFFLFSRQVFLSGSSVICCWQSAQNTWWILDWFDLFRWIFPSLYRPTVFQLSHAHQHDLQLLLLPVEASLSLFMVCCLSDTPLCS